MRPKPIHAIRLAVAADAFSPCGYAGRTLNCRKASNIKQRTGPIPVPKRMYIPLLAFTRGQNPAHDKQDLQKPEMQS
jgi:hypothetical protein